MCLSCGYYNGKQVVDLEKDAREREARMKAKRERIRTELGTPAPVGEETVEKLPATEEKKEPKSRVRSKKPEKKPE